jgi:hypothetical protein
MAASQARDGKPVEIPPDQQAHPLAAAWSNKALTVALVAGAVSFFAAFGMPNYAIGAQAQIGIGQGQLELASLVCAAFPLAGLAGSALARWTRITGQLLVCLGGFGTCAVAVTAVVLAGPDQNTFLPLGEGGDPGKVAVCAIIASVAALTMVVASAIDAG